MPDAIQNVLKRIFSEWLPSTGYEHIGGPELEVYRESDSGYHTEVWIPIIDKK